MVVIFLAVVSAAMLWVIKTLLPEMRKPPQPARPPQRRQASIPSPDPTAIEKRLEKLEMMLSEKNKNINLLQTELKIFHIQVQNSDKIKSMLEEEIRRLREQNRIFRSELGLPTAILKEDSVRLFL